MKRTNTAAEAAAAVAATELEAVRQLAVVALVRILLSTLNSAIVAEMHSMLI